MVIIVPLLLLLLGAVGDVFTVVANSYVRYLYFLGGCVLMFVIDYFTSKNNQMLKTFHHESTHFLVNLITFRKILMLRVDTTGGVVSSIGKSWMLEAVSLAPYCFPLAAYVVMVFGYFFAYDMAMFYSIILGMAYAFHLLCVKDDFVSWRLLGIHQPDINQYPLAFSYLYIFCFWLFNTIIVLLSVRTDIVGAVEFLFSCFKESVLSLIS